MSFVLHDLKVELPVHPNHDLYLGILNGCETYHEANEWNVCS